MRIMKQSLNLQLSQRLTLTPQLKQSLKLLQLSSLDLETEIQDTLDSNPLLEREDLESEKLNISSTVEEQFQPNEQTDNLASEADFSNSTDDPFEGRRTTGNSHNENTVEFTQFASKQETLFEHLNWQIQMTTLSEKDKVIAKSILHSLDDEGYLTIELKEILTLFEPELEVELDEIQAVLSLIKTLEPLGIGAQNLSERLLLFLEKLPETTPGVNLAKTIVSDHLNLVATHNITKLKKTLGVDEHKLSISLSLITNLNPRITTDFKSDQLDYVIPDVIVKQKKDKWVANLNPNNQSKLRINQLYANMLKSDIDDAGSEFIQANLQQAKMFIKGLMSRYDTLLMVSQAIIERQQDFFNHGEHAMQPMILQDIANELDMHESTISRATSGKFLLSTRGVYELKYFFSSALNTTDGNSSSSTAIRSLIKKMVNQESKTKPLSDNKIAQQLEQQGHIVARRTVAKYRESMQIAPSSQRKSLT